MATVAEKKAAVGYRKEGPKCSNCKSHAVDIEVFQGAYHVYSRARNRRCIIHKWATKAQGWCPEHTFVEEEGNNADV